ncbi:MAG: NAD-dependent epimerase/dehydratase family protein [Flavobacteriales bacterium]
MKVALTGGSGFIGQAFLDRMLAVPGTSAAMHVKALSSSAQGMERLRVKHPSLEVDVLYDRDGGVNADAFEGAHTVLHLGWSSVPGTAKADPVADLRTNVEGGIALLQAMVRAGVQRIIFVSSGGTVYGDPVYLPIDERHPVAPRTPYGASKLIFEHYLRCMADLHGFRPVVLRPGNIYGRTDGPEKPQGVVEHWFASIASQRAVKVWNGLDVVRDYIHIDDVVEVLIRLIRYDGEQRLFNVGTGIGTSLRDLALMMERVTGSPVVMDQTQLAPPDVQANILDPSLLIQELGVPKAMALEEGLVRTWSRLAFR